MVEILYLIIGIVGLYYGAEWLVSGSSGLALRLGVTPLVIGLTVVALGTSAPELAVCLSLNLNDSADAAMGNVVGSNICNILLVLGISGIIRPLAIKMQILRRELPILFLVSLILVAMWWDRRLMLWEGVILVIGIIIYIWTSFASGRSASDQQKKEFTECGTDDEKKNGSVIAIIFLIIGGGLFLVAGAQFFQKGGIGLAKTLGVSEAVIGLSVLAFGTSLPELATSIVACMKNQSDIIAGNAVGSSIFNILAILGITVLVKPMRVSGIEAIDLCFMLGTVLIAVGFISRKLKLGRTEGACLMIVYAIYVAMLVNR